MTSTRWVLLSLVGLAIWVGAFIANLLTNSTIGVLVPIMVCGLAFQFVALMGARRARYRPPKDFSGR